MEHRERQDREGRQREYRSLEKVQLRSGERGGKDRRNGGISDSRSSVDGQAGSKNFDLRNKRVSVMKGLDVFDFFVFVGICFMLVGIGLLFGAPHAVFVGGGCLFYIGVRGNRRNGKTS